MAKSRVEHLRRWARRLKNEVIALALAMTDARTPWYARATAFLVAAHTFSPIDLIPDFIPVLGVLDDLLVTPLGVWLAVKMIPPEVMTEARRRAAEGERPGGFLGRAGLALTAAAWLAGLLLAWLAWSRYAHARP